LCAAARRAENSAAHTPKESLPGLEQQQAELREALEATLLHGHNSAILLVGQRGSGKSAALRRVLLELKRLHNPSGLSFQEVYVSGTLHTDDRAALREITRQLCRENEIELLRSESFAENLRFVTQVLSQTKEAGIPVLFIVDEFDAFTRSAKQALLYNLSELLHSQRASMAVIGLSSRLDAYDRLEKRIRSRITYRKIVFTHLRDDQCVAAALQQALLLPAAESAVDAPPLKRRRGAATANTEGEVSDAGAAHNRAVTALLASAELRALLQRNLQLGRDMGWFFNLAVRAVREIARLSLLTRIAPSPPSPFVLPPLFHSRAARGSLCSPRRGRAAFDAPL
jgi:nucleoside-triphosphatase THEP1